MADTSSPAPKARSPLWIRILLVASLALNVTIVGIVGGAVLRGGGGPVDAAPGGDFRLFVSAMPDEHRKAMRRAFFEQLAFLRERRTEMFERRAQMIALLREAELDEGALRALMEAQQAGWVDLGRRGQVLIFERVQMMTPQDRAQFADNLEKAPRRRDGRWDRDHGPRPPRDGDR